MVSLASKKSERENQQYEKGKPWENVYQCIGSRILYKRGVLELKILSDMQEKKIFCENPNFYFCHTIKRLHICMK